jgi:hypothetical protein
MQRRLSVLAATAAMLLTLGLGTALAQQPARDAATRVAQAEQPMVISPQPDPYRPHAVQPGSPPPPPPGQEQYGAPPSDPGGPGQPYTPGPGAQEQPYVPPEAQEQSTFSMDEIKETGHRFFGRVSTGFAGVIEYAFQRAGRPNGYILGEEAGGAFIAGLRYGEGVLYTKDAGEHRLYWQGPSLGYDFGAEGSKTMVLVYNLRSPAEIYSTYGGLDGSAYLIGGVGITFLTRDHVVLAPIRSGVGLRLGANVGYLKYTRQPTWNPF